MNTELTQLINSLKYSLRPLVYENKLLISYFLILFEILAHKSLCSFFMGNYTYKKFVYMRVEISVR